MNMKAMAVSFVLLGGAGAHAQDGSEEVAKYLQSFQDAAPPRLVVFGHYSDRRFIDMMVPHHAMAVEMAEMALDRALHPELRAMARDIVDSQSSEIDEMKAIKEANFGTGMVPSKMNPINVENMGMISMEELQQAADFDCAFLDSMIPHHAAAIPLASVVLRRSDLSELKDLARAIKDAQSREIGEMESWLAAWCTATQ